MALARSVEARVLAAPVEAARDGEGVVRELEVRGGARGGRTTQAAADQVKHVAALRQDARLESREGDRVVARGALAEVEGRDA
jgi:hypothetical protein